MPNGTYGGVRGKETEVGQKTFVSRPTRFMERRIPIRRRVGGEIWKGGFRSAATWAEKYGEADSDPPPRGRKTGPRGALAAVERKLHDSRLKELVAMTSDYGGGSESAFSWGIFAYFRIC